MRFAKQGRASPPRRETRFEMWNLLEPRRLLPAVSIADLQITEGELEGGLAPAGPNH